MRELIVVGAGAVGRTLGRVLQHSGAFQVVTVISRNLENASAAACFIAGGDAIPRATVSTDLAQALRPGAAIMISTPDRVIESIAQSLAAAHLVDAASVVFHCSGALSSEVLAACRNQQASVASVHPLASFADPAGLAEHFAGVVCAAEGDAHALELLEPAFISSGARVMRLSSAAKTLYHAGAVLASGHIAAVIGAALEAERAAGIESTAAVEMLAPLIRITLENVLKQGARAALTGPLPRGDDAVVSGHYQALLGVDPALARCYAELTRYAAHMLDRSNPLDEIAGR